ncbi:PREDICTED: mucin-5AC-like, partial [Priapulus caudatus]|uniref:Mucin-5AC-like n=1 Tax=Priapulus caudatus TaxID=37621 RepID=A0ABM1E5V2_PRICU
MRAHGRTRALMHTRAFGRGREVIYTVNVSSSAADSCACLNKFITIVFCNRIHCIAVFIFSAWWLLVTLVLSGTASYSEMSLPASTSAHWSHATLDSDYMTATTNQEDASTSPITSATADMPIAPHADLDTPISLPASSTVDTETRQTTNVRFTTTMPLAVSTDPIAGQTDNPVAATTITDVRATVTPSFLPTSVITTAKQPRSVSNEITSSSATLARQRMKSSMPTSSTSSRSSIVGATGGVTTMSTAGRNASSSLVGKDSVAVTKGLTTHKYSFTENDTYSQLTTRRTTTTTTAAPAPAPAPLLSSPTEATTFSSSVRTTTSSISLPLPPTIT